jgi:type ISP restriction-modification system protein/N-6 DNA methylase
MLWSLCDNKFVLLLCDRDGGSLMTPLEKFLHDVYEIHSSRAAVDETPYYGSLETLINEVGKTLKPRVRCIIHIKNQGAGLPDGGLFTAEQFDKKSGQDPKEGQPPSRGAIEVKAPSEDATRVALGEQATRYLSRYRQVLVTNLRQFILVGHDLDGSPAILEKYELADSETNFWKAAAHPRKTDDVHGARFAEYLKRVMLHAAPVAAPEDVAFFLASYARDALARIEGIQLDALAAIRSALEEALGLKFEGKKGEHFFHSSLIQTLFYGVFSAWVLWARKHPTTARERFDWNATARLLRVPVIRKLFHEVADPGQLEELNLAEVLDWTAAVLNRVDRPQFFNKFQEAQAVQYFYEPFLEEFDPELRKQLGVWYTPHEVVEYMVERVDTVLREELGLADGLADPKVYVLDPCCGTGSFLVEVLHRIHKTLKAHGDDALIACDLKEAAMNRIFGFEILPAPFVVSHLQIGLLLDKLGTPLLDRDGERSGVYLTNALTGWEPPKGPKQHLIFPELEEERDAAEGVKRDAPILVVLGNPPYNGFAGVSPVEEEGLLEPYKAGLKKWGITKNYLNDLYVRFFRVAERRIADITGRGVVCYISNFSYLGDPSFVVMRKRFLGEFDKLWFDCLNGDSRETGKVTPEGKPDPSIFSTKRNPEGIRVGTSIGLFVRGADKGPSPRVAFRHFWGSNKKSALVDSMRAGDFDAMYEIARPTEDNRYSFRPSHSSKAYYDWPSLDCLAEKPPMLGLNENRGEALHDISRAEITRRMKAYYDPSVSMESLRELNPGLASNAASFDASATRTRLQRESKFRDENVRRFLFKPFDLRWAYIERIGNLWNRVRPELLQNAKDQNHFILVRRNVPKSSDGSVILFCTQLADQHALHKDAYFIPVMLSPQVGNRTRQATRQMQLHVESAPSLPMKTNLSAAARAYLGKLGISNPVEEQANANLIWMHALAVGYSPAYLAENGDGIRRDWPRVPLPNSSNLLRSSARLGAQIAVGLDADSPVKGVSEGDIRPELRSLATPARIVGGNLKDTELALTAGWGHMGQGEVTMPGQGKLIEREYTKPEYDAICLGAEPLGLSPEQAIVLLGSKTLDVYLNDVAFWSNVPEKVWNCSIGGYQVIKKWLSYREEKLLGRPLAKDEVRYVQEMVRRIAAMLLLSPSLDANYRAVKDETFPWTLD